jgi:hypothetical protein
VDFFWNVPSVRSPYGFDGTKGAIVELFGWSFDDIAEECAFLGQSGYLGVRIWPPNGTPTLLLIVLYDNYRTSNEFRVFAR